MSSPPRPAASSRARSMEATNLAATLGALGLAQHRVAQLFGVGPRSVRRWQHGDRRVPCGVSIVIRLLAAGVVTVAQVEQAAVPVSARTNGSDKPEPSAPLLVEPAPEQSALAALADPSLSTAERVCALAPEACRWPYGDPRHPDFHFCGKPVVRGPYCEQHRTAAYMAPRTRRKTPPLTSVSGTPLRTCPRPAQRHFWAGLFSKNADRIGITCGVSAPLSATSSIGAARTSSSTCSIRS